jgi:hypothetical protein
MREDLVDVAPHVRILGLLIQKIKSLTMWSTFPLSLSHDLLPINPMLLGTAIGVHRGTSARTP